MAKRLIVNADDFGQSPEINRGIIHCFENGIVRSASLMVGYPDATEAAVYAQTHPALSVGLHVDLGEWKLTAGNWEAVYERADLNNPDEVKKELRRQLEQFYHLMQVPPTHIDSHQHVHRRDDLLPIFRQAASQLGVPLRHDSKLVQYCGKFYGQLEDGSAWHQAISVEGLISILEELPDGYTELACHPAYTGDLDTMYRYERQRELETLCDARVLSYVENAGIELCSFHLVRDHSRTG